MKRWLINFLKVALVAGIFYYLVATDRLNFEKLLLLWQEPSMLALLVGTLIFWVLPLAALRWWLLLRAIGLEVPFRKVNLLTWIGNFFNTTLPGAISGDVIKGYYIIRAQKQEGKTRAFTTLLIDRFVGLFGLIVMAFGSLVLNFSLFFEQPALATLATMILGLFAGTLVFYTIVLFPFKEGRDPFLFILSKLPGHRFLVKVYKAFKVYQHQAPTLFWTLLISVTIHSTIAFMFYRVARFLQVPDLDLATQLFIMPIGLITIAIPVAPGGLGVGHAAFDRLYHLVGVSGGADIFNIYILVQLSVFLLGGIPYFLYNEYHVPESEALNSVETEDENPALPASSRPS